MPAMTQPDALTTEHTPETKAVCRALCQSGKFETGQGGCAALCMSMLGSSRGGPHGCDYANRVHEKLAESILAALATEGRS